MKRINIFSLIFIILTIGSFAVAGDAYAINYIHPEVVWNTPTGNAMESITPLEDGQTWELVNTFDMTPGFNQTIGFSGTEDIGPGVNVIKLEWTEAHATSGGNTVSVFYGGTLYKVSPSGGVVTGTYKILTCSNQTVEKVTFRVYIESHNPYTPANFCPTGYVVKDGICIKSTTETPVIYSPEINCSDSGYVYLDGICIKSTVTGLQNCGDDTRQTSEECDGTDLSGCSANEYCIPPGQPNPCTCASPPTVTLLSPTADYCARQAIFKWTYASAQSSPQSAWQMQVGTNGNFTSGLIYNIKTDNSSATTKFFDVALTSENSTATCAAHIPPDCGHINYGVPYYWRVKVWDANNVASQWATSPSAYTFPYAHPGPEVSYIINGSLTPITTTPGKLVSFTDNGSKCYLDNGSFYACNSEALNTYQWWYGDGVNTKAIHCVADATPKCDSTTHTYIQNNPYALKTVLQICDDIGCCSAIKNINVGPSTPNPVPNWWEISPY